MSRQPDGFLKSPYGKTVLVTGASSGIGLCIARQLVTLGYTVYGASRSMTDAFPALLADNPSLEGLIPVKLDVMDETDCSHLVKRIVDEQGELAAVFHCAGFGIAGSVEETSLNTAHGQMDQLFYGTVHTVRPALPIMREQGRGLIVMISSMAASVPVPFQTYYSAAKAAVTAFATALADEMSPFHVQVTVVSPGDTKTGFTKARRVVIPHEGKSPSHYHHRIHRSVKRMAHDEQNGLDPEAVARVAVRNMTRKNPPLNRTPGFFYKLVMLALRILPTRLFRWVIRLLYA